LPKIPATGFEIIVRHYESCLETHGLSPKGVDWPDEADLAARFEVMLSCLQGTGGRVSLLDLGCGPGFLLDYLSATGRLAAIDYHGIDLSERMVDAARRRWPAHSFECRDLLTNPLPPGSVDLVVMNGVLTERCALPREEMIALARALIKAAFAAARTGVAFNVMSRHVDWERDDLFHWGFDEIAAFLRSEVSRHYRFHADYGLYEFTTLVRREPFRPVILPAGWWQS